ncbi:uncharacterized protein TRIREDRAFT_108870 [Trichoderma reesei QM6a]|uniref:Predicted protein n=2 Tax=Hypocrea jecorina TaxID=51453 RepID=G0RMZ1_HYPJQ|nr:uncharacterized protein TRIREDRAFT_108870 [Trichoderma reesei QM6a]EGR47569.1 predicted protein [Trichoderma reesei QM6a]ETS00841.1 hypothetical protein M419DRAFT_131003 [Trichoderma reesei RUT C-30]
MTDSKTVKQPVKRVLKPVPDHGAYVHSSKTKFNDQFALPGSVPEPEIVRINTMAVPQPFLEPDKLEQWK